MATFKQNPSDAWSVLPLWVAASLVGWAAGLAVAFLVTLAARAVIPGLNEDRFAGYAMIVSVGLFTGLTQWAVLRGYLPRPVRWVLVTLAGYLLCPVLMAVISGVTLGAPGSYWDDALLILLLGAAVGILQWWVLRQHYSRAWVWVPATAVGFLSTLWLVANPAHTLGELVFVGAIVGALASAVPGVALVWLAQKTWPAAA